MSGYEIPEPRRQQAVSTRTNQWPVELRKTADGESAAYDAGAEFDYAEFRAENMSTRKSHMDAVAAAVQTVLSAENIATTQRNQSGENWQLTRLIFEHPDAFRWDAPNEVHLPHLPKYTGNLLDRQLKKLEKVFVQGHFDTSRAQAAQLDQIHRDGILYVETASLYVCDGITPSDIKGLEIMRAVREVYPNAKPRFMVDNYHPVSDGTRLPNFDDGNKRKFWPFVESYFRRGCEMGAFQYGEDPEEIFIAETDAAGYANERLVPEFQEHGFTVVDKRDRGIDFSDPWATDPRFRSIRIVNRPDSWRPHLELPTCAAADAMYTAHLFEDADDLRLGLPREVRRGKLTIIDGVQQRDRTFELLDRYSQHADFPAVKPSDIHDIVIRSEPDEAGIQALSDFLRAGQAA